MTFCTFAQLKSTVSVCAKLFFNQNTNGWLPPMSNSPVLSLFHSHLSLFACDMLRNRPQLTKGHSSAGLRAIVMLSDSERQKSMFYWLTLNGGSAQLIYEVYPQEQETLVREKHMQHFAVGLLWFSFMCFPLAVGQVSHCRWFFLTQQLTEWNGTRGCVLVSQHALFINNIL